MNIVLSITKNELTCRSSKDFIFQDKLFVAVSFENILHVICNFINQALICIVEPCLLPFISSFGEIEEKSDAKSRSANFNLLAKQVSIQLGTWEGMLRELKDNTIGFNIYHGLNEGCSISVCQPATCTYTFPLQIIIRII